MYKLLLILLAFSSTSLCQLLPNVNDAPLNDTRESLGPLSNSNDAEDIALSNHNAAQQLFGIIQAPQQQCKGSSCCVDYVARDDYVAVAGLGAYKLHSNRRFRWNEARKWCMQEGGHLVILNSQKEESFLTNWLQRLNNRDNTWIGAHDMFEEGDWVTLTGESLTAAGFDKWTPLIPNDPDNAGGNQNCAALSSTGMDDLYCDSRLSFFCEIDLC